MKHHKIFSGAAFMLLSLAALSGCTETLTVEAGQYKDYSYNPGETGDLERTDIAPLRNPDHCAAAQPRPGLLRGIEFPAPEGGKPI